MKLAYVRSVDAKQRYDAADSFVEKAKIAMEHFDKEIEIVNEQMNKYLEECHLGKTID